MNGPQVSRATRALVALAGVVLLTGCSGEGAGQEAASPTLVSEPSEDTPATEGVGSDQCAPDENLGGAYLGEQVSLTRTPQAVSVEMVPFSVAAIENTVFVGGSGREAVDGENPATLARIKGSTGDVLKSVTLAGQDTGDGTLLAGESATSRIGGMALSATRVYALWYRLNADGTETQTLLALDSCSLAVLATQHVANVDLTQSQRLVYDAASDTVWMMQGSGDDDIAGYDGATLAAVASVPIPLSGPTDCLESANGVLWASGISVYQIDASSGILLGEWPELGSNPQGSCVGAAGDALYLAQERQILELFPDGTTGQAWAADNAAVLGAANEQAWALTFDNKLMSLTTGESASLPFPSFRGATTTTNVWIVGFDDTLYVL